MLGDETIGAKIEKLFTNIKIRLLTYCFVSYDFFFENLLSHRITISQRISFNFNFFFILLIIIVYYLIARFEKRR